MRTLMLAVAFACGPVLAAGDPPAETRDPVIEKAAAATKRQDWAGAADVLRDVCVAAGHAERARVPSRLAATLTLGRLATLRSLTHHMRRSGRARLPPQVGGRMRRSRQP